MLDAQGQPHLSVEQHKMLFNIISLESRLDEIEKIKKVEKNIKLKYKYDVRIHRLKKQLNSLTLDKFPKEVIETMLFRSQQG
ncbi:hypothetical protein A9Q87_04520 [Flavobacteriales bacterium 34_180_T64]|nr:hypothetical protein A9Q87_04520 [Flavobacteriales bacterium 34_180_T64]